MQAHAGTTADAPATGWELLHMLPRAQGEAAATTQSYADASLAYTAASLCSRSLTLLSEKQPI